MVEPVIDRRSFLRTITRSSKRTICFRGSRRLTSSSISRAQHQAGRRLTDRITQLLVQRVAEFHDVSLNAEVNLGSPVRQTPSATKASRCRLLCRLDGSFTID